MKKIKKYQEGSLVESPDQNVNESLSQNQLDTISVNDLIDQMLEKSNQRYAQEQQQKQVEHEQNPIQRNEEGDIQNPNDDDIDSMLNMGNQVYDDYRKNKRQEILDTYGDITNEQRVRDLENLARANIDTRGVNIADIQFFSTTEGLKERGVEIPEGLTGIRKAVFPDGREYLFTDKDNPASASAASDANTRVSVVKSIGSSFANLLDIARNVTNTTVFKAATLNIPGLLEDREKTQEEKSAGLLYNPWTKAFKEHMDQYKIHVAQSDEAIARQKRLEAKKLEKRENAKDVLRKQGVSEEEIERQFSEGEFKDFGNLFFEADYWGNVFSHEFYNEQALQGLESAIEFITPGAIVAKGAKVGSLAAKIIRPGWANKLDKATKATQNIYKAGKGIDIFSAAAAMGALEAHMEGSHAAESIAVDKYNSLVYPDDTEKQVRTISDIEKEPDSYAKLEALDEYDIAYTDMFNANLIPLTLLNSVPMATLVGGGVFKKLGDFGARVGRQRPIIAATADVGANLFSEGLQEAYQTGVERFVQAQMANGLHDSSLLENIWGGLSNISNIGKDQETTDSFILGAALGSGTSVLFGTLATIDQLEKLSAVKKALKNYNESDFTSLARTIDVNGNLNIPEIAGKIKALDRAVISEEFLEATKELGDADLINYAYEQALSSLVYDALNNGSDVETLKDSVRNILLNTFNTDTKVEDIDGNRKDFSEILDSRLNTVDKLAHDFATVQAREKKFKSQGLEFSPRLKRSAYDARIGQRYFLDLFNDLNRRLQDVNKQITSEISIARTNDPKKFKDIKEGEEAEIEINEPVRLLRKDRDEIQSKLGQVVNLLQKYGEMTDTLSKTSTVKENAKKEKEEKVKKIITETTDESKSSEENKQKIKEALASEDLFDKDTSETVDDEINERNKQIADELRFSILPAEARKEGATASSILNMQFGNRPVEDWEKEIRLKALEEQLAIQEQEAEREPTTFRYNKRPLLLARDAKRAAKDLTVEELEELKNLYAQASGRSLSELDDSVFMDPKFIEQGLIDSPQYRSAWRTMLISKFGREELVKQEHDKVSPKDLFGEEHESDQGVQDAQNPPPPTEEPPKEKETPLSEVAYGDINSIWTPHVDGAQTYDPTIEYTTSVEEFEKGKAYIHMGLLKEGDTVHLEIEPGLLKNADVSWTNVRIQVVAYNGNDRIVIGHLKFYTAKTATPLLKSIREDIYRKWAQDPSAHYYSGWSTTINEILKGKITKDKLAKAKNPDKYREYPSITEVLKEIDLTIDDVELGMYGGTRAEPTPYSTGGAAFHATVNRQTDDPETGTGFMYLLLRSHKTSSNKDYWEIVPVFTKRVTDIDGYKEKIIELMDKGDLAGVQMMVKWRPKGREGYYPAFAVEDGTAVIKNNRGGVIAKGGQEVYDYYEKEFGISNKPAHIDLAWFKKFAGERRFQHPFFGQTTLKEIAFKHLGVTDIKKDDVYTYSYQDKTMKTFFRDANFFVDPWSKPSIPAPGVPIVGSVPTETPPTPGITVEPKPEKKEAPKVQPNKDEPLAPVVRPGRRPKLKLSKKDSVIYEDEKKSLKWFKSRLEEIGYTIDDAAIKELHKVLKLGDSAKIWGVAKDAAVTLASKRPEGTTRHEAFHIVFNVFLSDKQRETAYQEAWKLFGDRVFVNGKKATKEQFEEELKQNLFGPRYSIGERKASQGANIKLGVPELFESNPELANAVYEALGFEGNTIEADIENTVTEAFKEKIFRIGTIPFEKTEFEDINVYVKKKNDNEFSIAVDNKGRNIFGLVSAVLDFQRRDLDSDSIYAPNPKGFILWETFLNSETASTPKAKVIVDNRFSIALGALKALKNNGIEHIHFPERFEEDFKKEYTQFLKQEFSSVGFTDVIDSRLKTIQISIDDLIRIISLKSSDSNKIITPQQKQQAQQLYSQYLDTIFPDSKVKDIVYHSTIRPFSAFDFTKRTMASKDLGDGFYFSDIDHIDVWKKYQESNRDFVKGLDAKRKELEKSSPLLKKAISLPFLVNLTNPYITKDFYGSVMLNEDRYEEFKKGNYDGVLERSKSESSIRQGVIYNTSNVLSLGSKQDIEGFKKWKKDNISDSLKHDDQITRYAKKLREINERRSLATTGDLVKSQLKSMDILASDYQNNTNQSTEDYVASEKTIRDLAARMSDRIGIPVRFESDRTKEYKGKLENGTAIVNLAYATLDTPIHEILGHPIIRAIKNRSNYYKEGDTAEFHGYGGPERVTITKIFDDTLEVEFRDSKGNIQKADLFELTKTQNTLLYQNLLKELEYGKGKEVLDRVKRDYNIKKQATEKNNDYEYEGYIYTQRGPNFNRYNKSTGVFEETTEVKHLEALNYYYDTNKVRYTLEEQQEEAIVELLGLYTADRLDKVKDGKLISLLKRLLKEMKAFMKSLIGQKEVEIDKLPDNMTLGGIADLLAYSNSKIILPGNEVVYTTPDNQQFKTYAEASKHISELAKSVEDVDLSDIELFNLPDKFETKDDFIFEKINGKWVLDFTTINPTYNTSNSVNQSYKKINKISITEKDYKNAKEKGIIINDALKKKYLYNNEIYEFFEGISFFDTKDEYFKYPKQLEFTNDEIKEIYFKENKKDNYVDDDGEFGTGKSYTRQNTIQNFIEKTKNTNNLKRL